MKRRTAVRLLLLLAFITEQVTPAQQRDKRAQIGEMVEDIHGPQGVEGTHARKIGRLNQGRLMVALLQPPAQEPRGRILELTKEHLIPRLKKLETIGADATAKIADSASLELSEQRQRFSHIGRTMAAFLPDDKVGQVVGCLAEKPFALLDGLRS